MMTDLESLYLRFPVWLQNCIITLQGYRINRSRYGKTFHALLKDYEERASWDAQRLREYRDKRLCEFVKHCEATVPYYRNLFHEKGISSSDIRTLEDLKLLPILTKEVVQERYSEFLSEAIPENRRIILHTSGTTGAGLRFAATSEALSEQWAVWWRYRRWHGIDLGVLCGYFGGRLIVSASQKCPPFWRYDRPSRRILFSSYHMNPKNLDDYVAELREKQPPWLHGYPSALSLLASHLVEKGQSLGYEVAWVTSGAENLLSHQVKLMEKAFGIRPLQHYGLAESVANVSQCEEGSLHVDEDFSLVEFIPLEGKDAPCRIIGTNLTNPAFPLIRYDTGDLATLSKVACTCQHPGRVVASIDGRNEDYITLPGGVRLGRLDHIFKDLVHIREAQIYQPDLKHLVIYVVKGNGYNEHNEEARLIQEVHLRLSNKINIDIQYVPEIPRTQSGKIRFVISDVS